MAAKKKAAGDKAGKGGSAPKSVRKGDAFEGGKPKKPVCPKCGPGIFMATHKDRVSCGKCGYTEFGKKD
ncbi:MAG: 30S ribosomal protein S27ae [Thermoplasmatales archaeon]|nr:30S ribosomal protein S27ae [Thermoplasmatales archaeon]